MSLKGAPGISLGDIVYRGVACLCFSFTVRNLGIERGEAYELADLRSPAGVYWSLLVSHQAQVSHRGSRMF